ncbi:hypothetical protein F4679DRAFT_167789 [Xylaria curta]|nr:hypothetical protein F4679DRAFT_167789 [Xylaria curta]
MRRPQPSENDIAAALASINRNLERMHDRLYSLETDMLEVKGSLRRLGNGMGWLQSRMSRIENNTEFTVGRGMQARTRELSSIARFNNSRSTGPNYFLQPLYSPFTNQAIPGFPRTKEEFDNLSDDRVAEILRLLGWSDQGSPDRRLSGLREICGISNWYGAGISELLERGVKEDRETPLDK